MRKPFAIFIAVAAWFAVIAQLYLMLQNRVVPVPETLVRFISFFTILTNSIVAIYFTRLAFIETFVDQKSSLTAVTIYITVVGLIYQVLLRHIWQPQGLQKIVDELLHTIIPLLVIIYWAMYAAKQLLKYAMIPRWLLYPLLYLAWVLFFGYISHWYPYPFVNVDELGWPQTLINCAGMTALFIVMSALFIFIGKGMARRQQR
ncbi:MAG: Pr6Pr family membrane protein [Ferruginibacter sp.]